MSEHARACVCVSACVCGCVSTRRFQWGLEHNTHTHPPMHRRTTDCSCFAECGGGQRVDDTAGHYPNADHGLPGRASVHPLRLGTCVHVRVVRTQGFGGFIRPVEGRMCPSAHARIWCTITPLALVRTQGFRGFFRPVEGRMFVSACESLAPVVLTPFNPSHHPLEHRFGRTG